jgi:hypothetical protein
MPHEACHACMPRCSCCASGCASSPVGHTVATAAASVQGMRLCAPLSRTHTHAHTQGLRHTQPLCVSFLYSAFGRGTFCCWQRPQLQPLATHHTCISVQLQPHATSPALPLPMTGGGPDGSAAAKSSGSYTTVMYSEQLGQRAISSPACSSCCVAAHARARVGGQRRVQQRACGCARRRRAKAPLRLRPPRTPPPPQLPAGCAPRQLLLSAGH